MATIPAPTFIVSREEWPDADFDLPDGDLLHATTDKDPDDEDWDIDFSVSRSPPRPLRKGSVVSRIVAKFESAFTSVSPPPTSQTFTIRPPTVLSDTLNEDDVDDEGVSTIKVTVLPGPVPKQSQSPIEEDFEDAFALPSDLTQLSLAPLSLNHRSSKNSLEWGDKDQTSSSQSSDAYSSLGFADPSSNSTSSASQPETETEDDDDDDIDGLVLPSALFETSNGIRQLTKMLDMKKQAPASLQQPKVVKSDPEDDIEIGLVIDDDVDLSPSRLLGKQPHNPRKHTRSQTAPTTRPSSLRPPSRTSRAKSPLHPPTSSARQLQRIQISPPPSMLPTPSQLLKTSSASPIVPSPSTSSFLFPKPGSLRGQKSYSGLKPPTPPLNSRGLSRKASLSSLIEASNAQASGSGSSSITGSSKARYEEPTAASRAKSHKFSTSRVQDFKVPPTRPHTPSSNPVAIRLTMPTQLRTKVRPALSTVFGAHTVPKTQVPARSSSPLPPRPPSSSSIQSQRSNPTPPAPKLLRRPKRQRTYGDGTELDGIEDLPTDPGKEQKYRVQPKSHGNRIPGASYPSKPNDKWPTRSKSLREGNNEPMAPGHFTPSAGTLRRTTTRIEFPSKPPDLHEKPGKKKKPIPSPQPHTKRKPTLIRNLNNSSSPKVVGEMKWNPSTLRWEGNDHILRDFDVAVGTSTRPALITHLTGSSIGSPLGPFASGARVVGNMVFDPTKMCWISTLPPEEDEPDVFANMADDEEDSDAWETKGGTIRASLQPGSVNSSISSRRETPSPAHSHSRTISESGSDRGSRASIFFDIDELFLESCRQAEERHRTEIKSWISILDSPPKPDRSSLYEIRALATRKY